MSKIAQENKTGNDLNIRKRFNFFGAHIDPLTMEETLGRIDEIIRNRKVTQHVVINVAKLVMMQKDNHLREIINSCGLINVDGQGIVWGAQLMNFYVPERVAGIDLMQDLIKHAAWKGYRVYLLGASEEVIKTVVNVWYTQYPNLEIAGYRNGYFSEREESEIVANIQNSHADILFVAMSSPKKELFLNKYLDSLGVPFTMGVGGSFDVVAGKIKRAPVWMQQIGLEWFFRFLSEPKRMWRRYLVTNTVFAWMLVRALFEKCLLALIRRIML